MSLVVFHRYGGSLFRFTIVYSEQKIPNPSSLHPRQHNVVCFSQGPQNGVQVNLNRAKQASSLRRSSWDMTCRQGTWPGCSSEWKQSEQYPPVDHRETRPSVWGQFSRRIRRRQDDHYLRVDRRVRRPRILIHVYEVNVNDSEVTIIGLSSVVKEDLQACYGSGR